MHFPIGLVETRRSPLFDADNVPPALLSDHISAQWAKLFVESGKVEFFESESIESRIIYKNQFQVIKPKVKHYIKLSKSAKFYIVFYSKPVEISQKG